MSENEYAWLKKVVEDKAYLLHEPTGVIGIAKAFHAPHSSKSSVNGEPVEDWVIEFTDGNTFLAREMSFKRLNENDIKLYEHMTKALAELVRTFAMGAAVLHLTKEILPLLIRNVLRRQMSALVRT